MGPGHAPWPVQGCPPSRRGREQRMSCKWRRGQLWAMATTCSPRRRLCCQNPWALGRLWRRLGATEPSHDGCLPSALASVPPPPLTQPRPSGCPTAWLGNPALLLACRPRTLQSPEAKLRPEPEPCPWAKKVAVLDLSVGGQS